MLTDEDLEKIGRLIDIKLAQQMKMIDMRFRHIEERISEIELQIKEIKSDIGGMFLHFDSITNRHSDDIARLETLQVA